MDEVTLIEYLMRRREAVPCVFTLDLTKVPSDSVSFKMDLLTQFTSTRAVPSASPIQAAAGTLAAYGLVQVWAGAGLGRGRGRFGRAGV